MLNQLIIENDITPSSVLKFDASKALKLDLSRANKSLDQIDLNDEREFSDYIFNQLSDGQVGYGGYGEERSLYRRSTVFDGEEARSIHLGLDLWTSALTPVYSPLDAVIHSFDNHAVHGDYGPVIILEHQLGSKKLFSLYGHLTLSSLDGKKTGQKIKKGEHFASIGAYHENYHWPPHLHFQLMWDMQGHIGDYPGVCRKSESQAYLENCPDPKLLIF